MRWEELSTDRFAEAVKECEGVCLVALSVIEMTTIGSFL